MNERKMTINSFSFTRKIQFSEKVIQDRIAIFAQHENDRYSCAVHYYACENKSQRLLAANQQHQPQFTTHRITHQRF